MRALRLSIVTLLFGALSMMASGDFTRDFNIESCNFAFDGGNPYFTLERGAFSRFEGTDDEGVFCVVEITVTSNKKVINFDSPNGEEMSVKTRIIEEREWEDGELVEVSKNYFARCKRTDTIFYFGEKVNDYENGVIVSNEGEWRAGRDGAMPGVIMPGMILSDSKYFQEVAPDVAMDRAKHVDEGFTYEVPAGIFHNCIKVVETTPLEEDEKSVKIYAPGVGLIYDDGLELVEWNH